MKFTDVKENIWKKKEDSKILIAGHRGISGGNIVQNTIAAYENALKHGSDILEVDIIMSTDGVFYALHDGQEKMVIGVDVDLRKMSSKEIESFNCINSSGCKLHQKLERLDNILEHFKGRCLINIDRAWICWNEAIEMLKKHNMYDQIILKSEAKDVLLQMLEESQSGFMFMPILFQAQNWDLVKKYKLNIISAEFVFKDLHSCLLNEEFMNQFKTEHILTWVNALTLDDDTTISGGLDDNKSILINEDNNWGRLIDMGFDIIQTDWPLLLKQYVNSRNAKFI